MNDFNPQIMNLSITSLLFIFHYLSDFVSNIWIVQHDVLFCAPHFDSSIRTEKKLICRTILNEQSWCKYIYFF